MNRNLNGGLRSERQIAKARLLLSQKRRQTKKQRSKEAVTAEAQALFDARDKDAFTAAVEAEAQALYDAWYKETFTRDLMIKAQALAKAMFDAASVNYCTFGCYRCGGTERHCD